MASSQHQPPPRELSLAEAQAILSGLVEAMSSYQRPARSLTARAARITVPGEERGAWLIPAADAEAAVRRETRLRQRLEGLRRQQEILREEKP